MVNITNTADGGGFMRYQREDGCRAWLTYGQLKPEALNALLTEEGSAEAIYDHLLRDGSGFLSPYTTAQQREILQSKARPEAMHEMMLVMRRLNLGILSMEDYGYPDALRTIADPPPLLFFQGNPDCLMGRCVAMVGSRRASPNTIEAAKAIACELSRSGVTIVSGLALGIDTAAHQGCLEGGSPTAAVLGCGMDVDYPVENAQLRRQIVERGGVLLSEYPPGTPALGWHFPVRNRILSGLCKGVIMMEARIRSGSMTTVNHALDQGREVFAYPGNIGSEYAEGAHQLLRDGAIYFTGAGDVLQDLGWAEEQPAPSAAQKAELPPMSAEQRKVYQLLSRQEMSFDELAEASDLDTPTLSGALTMLQILGLVRSMPGKTYGKI